MAKERIHFFDNLKGILIFLVVFGHYALPVHSASDTLNALYGFIYIFHMPLFVFVSGFFAKSIVKSGRLRIEKIVSILVLAILFQLLLIFIEQGGRPLSESLLSFGSAPWYLVALAWWYLLIPLFSQMRPFPAIVIAFIAALGINCFDGAGDFLAISRTVVFLPFFLLGYYCSKERFLTIKNSHWLPLVAALVAIFLFLWMIFGSPLPDTFYMVYGNGAYKGSSIVGMGTHAIYFMAAILISLAVVFVTPRQKTFLAVLGERTLQIYVLHRLIRPFMDYFGFFDMPILNDPVLGILVIFGVSVAITLVCSIGIIKKPFDLILNAKWKFLRPKGQDA